MNPSGNLSFAKGNFVEWMSGSWIQKGWDRFDWWTLRLGGGGTFWRRPSWLGLAGRAPFDSYPDICHTTKENHERPQSRQTSSQKLLVASTWLPFSGAASTGVLSISPPRLPVGDFSQPLFGTSAFQVTELRGSPHQLSSSQNSQIVLWCGWRRVESPNPREFAC
jgi:hypothetical protein